MFGSAIRLATDSPLSRFRNHQTRMLQTFRLSKVLLDSHTWKSTPCLPMPLARGRRRGHHRALCVAIMVCTPSQIGLASDLHESLGSLGGTSVGAPSSTWESLSFVGDLFTSNSPLLFPPSRGPFPFSGIRIRLSASSFSPTSLAPSLRTHSRS